MYFYKVESDKIAKNKLIPILWDTLYYACMKSTNLYITDSEGRVYSGSVLIT